MISKQWQTWIHHWFPLKHHITHESSKKRIHHQTSFQHNSKNNQPFQKTKPSWSSAWRDLFKACIDLSKWGGRVLTSSEEQSWFSCFFVCLAWNSYSKTLLMMNGEDALACNSLEWPQTTSAMDDVSLKQQWKRSFQLEKYGCNRSTMLYGCCIKQGKV